jgi:hypothetical protein
VAGFIGLLAVFGFGQLEAWPFTSWYMFSGVEPQIARVARAVAVAPDGAERVLQGDEIPLGLQSHRLLARFAAASGPDRTHVCDAVLRAARASGPVVEVRIFEDRWRVLRRSGDRPAQVERTPIGVCR